MVLGTLIIAGLAFISFVGAIASTALGQGGIFGSVDVATRLDVAEARASFRFRTDFRSAAQPRTRFLGAALVF